MTRTISIALMLALSTVPASAQMHLKTPPAQESAYVLSRIPPHVPVVPHAPFVTHLPVVPLMPPAPPVPVSPARMYGQEHPLPYLPPLPDGQEQAGDDLWRQAREELNKSNFRRASEVFERLIERYEGNRNVPNAYYWRAYALSRIGGIDDLEEAKEVLEERKAKYPRAGMRAEAERLLMGINSQLAQRGDSDAAEEVTARANTALRQQQCPRNEDEDIRDAALQALLNMDAANAVPILKSIMQKKDACSAPLRRKAVFHISQKRSSETEDMLLDAARNDPDSEVREQAVFWLSQVPTDKALTAIEQILNTSSNRAIQERAIFALSQHRSARAGQILRAWASSNDRPAELREKAIFHLSQHRDPENGRFLRELYGRLTDAKLKEQVIFAMSQRRGEGSERWLMDIALNQSEDTETRKKALFWAGQSRAVPVNDLITLYDRMADVEMKKQLIFVYSQRRESAVVDKMIDIARNERNTELRKQAIFWLGQSKDPRAVQALADIIGR